MTTTTKKTTKKSTRRRKTVTVQQKFVRFREDVNAILFEREGEADVVLSALLCREHSVLVGPPGTAKSLLLDMVMSWVDGATKFTGLLSKYTTPDELFGPVSVAGLKKDEYRRKTDIKLPEAEFAFLDEIFKAQTILNTLLRILNEREYDNGTGGLVSCPLRMAVAASNEWPDEQNGGGELGALFDRFLFRKIVRPISPRNRMKFLQANIDVKFRDVVTLDEVDQAIDEVSQMELTDDAWEVFGKILDELNSEGIIVGDRRMKKSVEAVKAFAYLNGKDIADVEDLEVLQHTLWSDPKEQPQKCADIVMKLSNPTAVKVMELMIQATDVITGTAPNEAVPKLKAIIDELDDIGTDKADNARQLIQDELSKIYSNIVGA